MTYEGHLRTQMLGKSGRALLEARKIALQVAAFAFGFMLPKIVISRNTTEYGLSSRILLVKCEVWHYQITKCI